MSGSVPLAMPGASSRKRKAFEAAYMSSLSDPSPCARTQNSQSSTGASRQAAPHKNPSDTARRLFAEPGNGIDSSLPLQRPSHPFPVGPSLAAHPSQQSVNHAGQPRIQGTGTQAVQQPAPSIAQLWARLQGSTQLALYARLQGCRLLPEDTASGKLLLKIELVAQRLFGVRDAVSPAEEECWLDHIALCGAEGVTNFHELAMQSAPW